MRQFNVAYSPEDQKVTVLPVAEDIPDNSTVIGLFDDRDLALPIDKLELREALAEKNGKEDSIVLHHIEGLLRRFGVEDPTEVKVSLHKDVKEAVKEAQKEVEDEGTVDPKAQNETAVSAQTKPTGQ